MEQWIYLQCKRREFNPWIRKIPSSRKLPPTPVFLPGKFHGQRSLVGYSPWGLKEPDKTEHTCMQMREEGRKLTHNNSFISSIIYSEMISLRYWKQIYKHICILIYECIYTHKQSLNIYTMKMKIYDESIFQIMKMKVKVFVAQLCSTLFAILWTV